MATKETLEKWFKVAEMVWTHPINDWVQHEDAQALSRRHADMYGRELQQVTLITLCVAASTLAEEEDAVCMCGDLVRLHSATSGHIAQPMPFATFNTIGVLRE